MTVQADPTTSGPVDRARPNGGNVSDSAVLQWRIRCSDGCGFIVTCSDEPRARSLASCENTHGVTLIEARTVTYGEWSLADDVTP